MDEVSKFISDSWGWERNYPSPISHSDFEFLPRDGLKLEELKRIYEKISSTSYQEDRVRFSPDKELNDG